MKPLNKDQKKRISKRLSYVLRHRPDTIDITLTDDGWVKVDTLLLAFKKHRLNISLDMLKEVVATNDKQRFAFSEDQTSIRANQGHSVSVNLGMEVQSPPEVLFHGTATRFIDSIQETGLQKQNRHHVHLSADEKTAHKVGSRHGKPIILIVNALAMHKEGFEFFKSDNHVWLTDSVPVKYIEFPD